MRILINPYGRYTGKIVCYSASLHLIGGEFSMRNVAHVVESSDES